MGIFNKQKKTQVSPPSSIKQTNISKQLS